MGSTKSISTRTSSWAPRSRSASTPRRTRPATRPDRRLEQQRNEGRDVAHVLCVLLAELRSQQPFLLANADECSREIERYSEDQLSPMAERCSEADQVEQQREVDRVTNHRERTASNQLMIRARARDHAP